jgi:hypothetical protein
LWAVKERIRVSLQSDARSISHERKRSAARFSAPAGDPNPRLEHALDEWLQVSV